MSLLSEVSSKCLLRVGSQCSWACKVGQGKDHIVKYNPVSRVWGAAVCTVLTLQNSRHIYLEKEWLYTKSSLLSMCCQLCPPHSCPLSGRGGELCVDFLLFFCKPIMVSRGTARNTPWNSSDGSALYRQYWALEVRQASTGCQAWLSFLLMGNTG